MQSELNYVFFDEREAGNFVEDQRAGLEECSDGCDQALRELYDALDEQRGLFFLFFAKNEGRIVGFTYGVINDDVVVGGWFVVDQSFRGLGIAAKLNEGIVENLGELGVTQIQQVAATPEGADFLCRQEYIDDGDGSYSLFI